MKRIKLIAILLVVLTGMLYAQKTPVEKLPPKWSETPTAWVLTGVITTLDSGVTVYTSNFDATYIITRILKGNMSAYTSRDTTDLPYLHSNDAYIVIRVKGGTNSVDTLSSVNLCNVDLSGNKYVVDTLTTNKSTPKSTVIKYWTKVMMADACLKIIAASITGSGYAMQFEYQIIVPKPISIER